MRPPLPADYRDAVAPLIAHYSDVIPPTELQALWWMLGRQALPGIARLRLGATARSAQARAGGRHHGR